MLIITSIGLSTKGLEPIFSELIQKHNIKNVAIITSAAEDRENNKFAQLAKQQLISFNIQNIQFIDLYCQDVSELEPFDLIYIGGGNTFALLKSIQQQKDGLNRLREILIRKDVIGVSAGSILLTPIIRLANEVEPDEYIEVDNFNALNLVPYEVCPHYEDRMKEELDKYKSKYNTIVKTLTNEEYFAIE